MVILAFVGCRETTTQEFIPIEKTEVEASPKLDIKPTQVKNLETNYTGDFYGTIQSTEKPYNDRIPAIIKKLKLTINLQGNNQLIANMLLDGNQFEFQGETIVKKSGYEIKLYERQKSLYEINAYLDTVKHTLKGTLHSKNAYGKELSTSLVLNKKQFTYKANLKLPETILGIPFRFLKEDVALETFEALTKGVLDKNASTQLLDYNELEYLPQSDLEVLRNSIYARHGYAFKNKPMRYLFENKVDWYFPNAIQVEETFTKIERKNIELIKLYEQHAEKYYDEFGR